MSRLRWLTLLSVLTLVIAACGTPAATTTTAAPTTTATTAAPPTTTDGTDFEGKSVAAQDCGYGGKILSIEATSQ
jgi:multidrug efflux pump subunit AcrA (membrane-fusion protein)